MEIEQNLNIDSDQQALDVAINSLLPKKESKQLLCSSNEFAFDAKQKKGAFKTDVGLNIAMFDNKTVEFQILPRAAKAVAPYVLTYNFRDILGAKVTGSRVEISIYSKFYQGVTMKKTKKSSINTLQRTLHHVKISCPEEQQAQEWCNRFINAAYGGDPTICDKIVQKKRILALLNPYGGNGTGPAKWQQAKKLLDLCHLDVTVKQTEYRNHAYEIVNKDIALGQYDGILTISGDGLIHEAINGIMNRADKEEFLKSVGFGCVPAGTANGLHKSITAAFQEECGILTAAFMCAKGRKCQLDLTEIDMEYQQNMPNKKVYMFLCMCYAIVADADINSEFLRFMGDVRFTLYGAYRIANVRQYPSKFTFKGKSMDTNIKPHNLTEADMVADQQIDEGFRHLAILNTSYMGQNIHSAPLSRLNDGMNDITLVRSTQSRGKFLKFMLALDSGEYWIKSKDRKLNGKLDPSLGAEYLKTSEWELKPQSKGPVPADCNYQNPEGTPTHDRHIYSIDGEKYPAQNIKGTVLKQALPLFC